MDPSDRVELQRLIAIIITIIIPKQNLIQSCVSDFFLYSLIEIRLHALTPLLLSSQAFKKILISLTRLKQGLLFLQQGRNAYGYAVPVVTRWRGALEKKKVCLKGL